MQNSPDLSAYADLDILLFDGVCNLCHRSVQFVLLRDKSARFHFAALQSPLGQALLQKHGASLLLDSVVLITPKRAYTHSAAALQIARRLPLPYPLLLIFWLVPYFLRDWIYNFVARRRYRWFGKQEEENACFLPRPEWRARFLG